MIDRLAAGLVSDLVARFGRIAGACLSLAIVLLLILGQAYAMYRMGWSDRDQMALNDRSEADNDQLRRLLLMADVTHVAIGDYFLRRGETRVEYRTIREAIPHATTQYRPTPDAPAQPLPQCVFTRAFVGVWNRALTATAGVPDATGRAAAAPANADATGLLDSGIHQRDLLENHVDNAETCTAIRQQLDALIDWHAAAVQAATEAP